MGNVFLSKHKDGLFKTALKGGKHFARGWAISSDTIGRNKVSN